MFEAESQPPIAADRHGEGPGSIAIEGMKSASPAQVAGASGAVDRVEHQAHALVKLWPDIARPPGAKDLSHAFVGERLDRHRKTPINTLMLMAGPFPQFPLRSVTI